MCGTYTSIIFKNKKCGSKIFGFIPSASMILRKYDLKETTFYTFVLFQELLCGNESAIAQRIPAVQNV